MQTNYKWMTWAIVLLFFLNVITLGIILADRTRQWKTQTVPAAYYSNTMNGRFFSDSLGFTNDQMQAFWPLNRQFRQETQAVAASIDSLKAEAFSEMQKVAPDTVELNRLSAEIGYLHGELKYHTCRFFLQTRSICSREQQIRLAQVFRPLFVNGDNWGRAPGQHRGWRRFNN